MTMPVKTALGKIALGALGVSVAGCANVSDRLSTPVNPAQTVVLPTEQNQIDVRRATEVLEVGINPAASELSGEDRRAVERFVATYRDRGHGKLAMAMPENGPYQQQSVEILKQIRSVAWENGVAWEQIEGSSFNARGANAPILLAFDVYEAVAPECLSLAAYDMSDVSSNNELGYYGCSVRANIAAMLSDPGDLLSRRELGAPDSRRVSLVMEAYRTRTLDTTDVDVGG